MEISVADILETLPHRYPFLLVDGVLELRENEYIKAFKNVSFNEPHFSGHFPKHPVMPGVLIIESMAQAAGILALTSMGLKGDDGQFFLVGVDNARFKRIVRPGDQLMMEISVIKNRQSLWKFDAKAFVGDELAASAVILNIRG